MEDLKEIKKKIKKDWLEAFPDLKATTPLRYFKIVGPCVIGLELIKSWSSNTYRPHLSINSLYHESNKKSIDGWIQIIELRNKKGLQFGIEYRWHEKYVERACERVKVQFGIFFNDGNIKLEDLLDYIDNELKDGTNMNNVGDEISLIELKYFLLLVYKSGEQLKYIKHILNQKEYLLERDFVEWFGDFDKWIENLKKITKEELNNKIEENISHKKLKKLNRFELI